MLKKLVYLFLCACYADAVSQENVVGLVSSNLPIIIINTGGNAIPDDPKITADISIIDNGPGMQNHPENPPNHFNGKMGISIRGSSSQMFPKKQYSIELRDEAGEDLEAELLGMPAEEDWVLFAPYNDKSLMRDVVAYKLGNDLSQYSPRTRFCEVMLNGRYQGVYVLIEKVKRDKNRVDINKLDPDEISGNNLTGGYIIKIDKTTGSGGGGWVSSYPPLPNPLIQQIFFQYETPEDGEIVQEQRDYIQQYVSEFEDVLAGANFDDPVNGYAKYIDVNSFIDYFLAQEITKNPDGYRLSTFFHKQRDSDGGKLVMGPIWDFNLGFGNVNYCTSGDPEGFVFEFNKICNQDYWLVPFWWSKLFQDDNFKTRLTDRWFELRATKWNEAVIHDYIDSIATILNAGSQQRNFTAWPVLNMYVWPNFYIGNSFGNEVNWLKGWIIQRLTWLDENLPQIITATEDGNLEAAVKAYPNPFSTNINFEYSLQKPGKVYFRLYDNMGRVVKSATVDHDAGGKFIYSMTADLPASIYHYTIVQGDFLLDKGKLNRR